MMVLKFVGRTKIRLNKKWNVWFNHKFVKISKTNFHKHNIVK